MELIKKKYARRGNSKRIKVKCIVCRCTFYHKPNFKARTCGTKCSIKWKDLILYKQNTHVRNIRAIKNMFIGQLGRYNTTT